MPSHALVVTSGEAFLREKFYTSIVTQSDLVDKLGGQLLTIELAIPGLYATVVKLVSGDKATVQVNGPFYLAFGCWLLALALTQASIIPKNWVVDPNILKQDPAKFTEALGIEDFFRQSAQYKRRLLIASSVLFFMGVFFAAYTFGP